MIFGCYWYQMPDYLPQIQEQIEKEFYGRASEFLESIDLESYQDDDGYLYIGVDPNNYDDSTTIGQLKQETLAKLIRLFGPDFKDKKSIGFHSGTYYNG
jgi:hypothetical protein